MKKADNITIKTIKTIRLYVLTQVHAYENLLPLETMPQLINKQKEHHTKKLNFSVCAIAILANKKVRNEKHY